MRELIKIVPIVLCVIGSEATAQQGGWLIETNSVVSPSNPTTTIEVWAWFDDPTGIRDAFAWGDFDLYAGDGEFSHLRTYFFWSFNVPGTVVPSGVTGVYVGQQWGGAGIHANGDNPILLWSAEWTTADFTPRTVSLNTLNTTTFNIGSNTSFGNMNVLELYPQGFTPGTGMIEVVPSPASAMPLVVVGAMMLRRRRPTYKRERYGMLMSLKVIPVFVCLAVVPALGQQIEGGWEIRTSNVVSPASPSTTVEIWAAWNDPSNSYCCFVFENFDLVAQEGVLSSPSVLLLPNAGWSQPGQVTGNGEAVRGVFVGQGIELPPHSPPNPILAWSATWTTTNFAPRSVGMWTENTTDFTVGKPSLNILQLLQLFPDNFVPGVGGITIIPSPTTAIPMVVLGAMMLRRRRPR